MIKSLLAVFLFSSMLSCCFSEVDCLLDTIPCYIRVVDSDGENLFFGPNKEMDVSDLTIFSVINFDTTTLEVFPIVVPDVANNDTLLLIEVKQSMTLLFNYQNDQDRLDIVANSFSNKCCPNDGVGIGSVNYNGVSLNTGSVLFDLVK